MRSWRLAIAAPVALALAVPGALAAGTTAASVKAGTSFRWSPDTVAIDPGESVRFSNPTLTSHDVVFTDGGRFDDGCIAEPGCRATTASPAWGARTRTFTVPGTYHFYCTIHGTAAGQGMYGTVIVRGAGRPAATPAPRRLVAHDGRVCRPHRRHCRPAFARVTFTLAQRARVGATIARLAGSREQRVAAFSLAGRRGINHVVLRRPGGRALGPGRYRITLRARAKGRTASVAVSTRFAIAGS
jgi:plastocyanin